MTIDVGREMITDATREGTYVGRIWNVEAGGPSVVIIRDGKVIDITSSEIPTVRDLCEATNPAQFVASSDGLDVGVLDEFLAASLAEQSGDANRLLAPIDLQAIKASGVTFAISLLERVIEEQARGNPALASDIRTEVTSLIGDDLSKLRPGSDEALELKRALIAKNVWSQYLEVGIGPDAEIFTKAQPMSSVGFGADIGVNPISTWNNPEPEIVLVIASSGKIVGATLGNDVNLRDVEGRSALLLGKAKDNNAACAIGPFIRLFDETFTLDDVSSLTVDLTVEGDDGFQLTGSSSMSEISRTPTELAASTINAHHNYPDGVVLFLGTMFAPTQDRDAPGEGFTHHTGDRVMISNERLGALVNTVQPTDACPPWTFGTSHLMRNLAARGLV